MIQKTILLVEDNPSDIELAQRAFEKNQLKHTLVVVEDGRQALEYLYGTAEEQEQRSIELPALILLDLHLPGMDGLEILSKIRSHPHTCMLPVVILTTSMEERDIRRSYELGANSYIRKPVDFNQFVQSIGQLGHYWLNINEPPPLR